MATVTSNGDISNLLQIDESYNSEMAYALAIQMSQFENTIYYINYYIFYYGAYEPIEITSSSFELFVYQEPVNGYVSGTGSGFLGSSGTITSLAYDGSEYNWELTGKLSWSYSRGIYSGTIKSLTLWNESNTERFIITEEGTTATVTALYEGITSVETFTSTSSGEISRIQYLSYADEFDNKISVSGSFAPPYIQKLGDLFDNSAIFGGNDTFNVDDDSRAWYGFAGNDIMNGGNRANSFYGGTGDDKLYGYGADDFLYGEDGTDYLDGGDGADSLSGGNGNDTYVVDDPHDVVVENANAGVDTVRATTTHTLADNVENLVLTGTAAIDGTGNALNNSLTGNDGDNVLDGGAGLDKLIGGKSDDTYVVDLILKGSGASTSVGLQDTLTEASGAGIDTLRLRGEWATTLTTTLVLGSTLDNLDASQTGLTRLNLTGNALVNHLTGNQGDNVLDGKAGVDTLIGGAGNDTYVLDNQDELGLVSEEAGSGNDTLKIVFSNSASTPLTIDLGSAGPAPLESDTLAGSGLLYSLGNAWNELLSGSVLNGILNGGVAVEAIPLTIDLSSVDLNNVENVTIVGSGLFDVLGNELDNTLTGNASTNTLVGGIGDDLLDGKGGSDYLYGGTGDDTYVVDNARDVVSEDIDEGTDTVRASVSWRLAANLENLVLTGTAGLSATGNELENVLTGNTAANMLDGDLGADQLIGGKGNDTYVVDDPGDVAVENFNEGVDTVRSAIDYTLADNVEKLILAGSADSPLSGTGNALNNTLTGSDGDNLLDGAAGVDKLVGGKGDDTYVVDLILKGSGASATVALQDTVSEGSSAGTDTLTLRGEWNTVLTTTLVLGSNLENLDASQTGLTRLNLTGNSLANVLTGNDTDNKLNGGAGNDVLDGGAGSDVLTGGTGADVMSGGTGLDTFVFSSTADLGLGVNQDVIQDFENGVDKLNFDALGGYTFIGDADFTGAKQLQVESVADGMVLYGNTDQNLDTAEFSILLVGVTSLCQEDLIL